MPINEILENDKNKEIIKRAIEAAKPKLEKYIDYPLYLKWLSIIRHAFQKTFCQYMFYQNG